MEIRPGGRSVGAAAAWRLTIRLVVGILVDFSHSGRFIFSIASGVGPDDAAKSFAEGNSLAVDCLLIACEVGTAVLKTALFV